MKCEPLIKDVSYLENTKPMTVNPHSKSFSAEGKDSVASRSRVLTFKARKMRLLEQGTQMEVTPGTDRVHEKVRSLQTTLFSPSYLECSQGLSGHHRGKKPAYIQVHYAFWRRCSVFLRQLKSSHEPLFHNNNSTPTHCSCDELHCATYWRGKQEYCSCV